MHLFLLAVFFCAHVLEYAAQKNLSASLLRPLA